MAVHSENDYKEETNDAVYDCIIADISIKTKLEDIKGALAHYSAFFSIFNPHALSFTFLLIYSNLAIYRCFLNNCHYVVVIFCQD